MAHEPALDLLNYLDAQTTTLTKGTNLFRGPVRAHSTAMPIQSAFVNSFDGRPPDRVLGTATEIRHASVSVIVRSSGFDPGLTLAWTVYTKLQSASPSTGNAYMDVRALQSNPNYLEQDKNLHHFWSLNFEVTYAST